MSLSGIVDASLLELFREEAESQTQVLTAGLLALDRDGFAADQLDGCMRAAHSLKGAALIVGLDEGVRVAHAIEDCFVAAQEGRLELRHAHVDLLLGAADLLLRIATTPEAHIEEWTTHKKAEVDGCVASLARTLETPGGEPAPAASPSTDLSPHHSDARPMARRTRTVACALPRTV